MIKLNYRKELDGLRGIAVLGVIIYHVEFFFKDIKLLSGGYLGVDIFFVISGYLITLLIIKEFLSTNTFSLKNFFFRRAKRILPALFLMIFTTIFFAWFYLTPKNFLEYSNSIISSIFFYSNYFFYFQDLIYSSEESLLKPLLHTWSLAVEEQFYIIFPLIMILFFKYIKKNILMFFSFFLIISFIVSMLITYNNSTLSFCSNFSRFWEILFGSLLAVFEIKNKKFNFKYENFLPYFGIFLIFISYILFDKYTLHPSYLTLAPILGVFFIIHYIKKDQNIYKILTFKPLSTIGLWSYSLYLWHYPIFAFARNRGKVLSDFDKLELLFLTFFLSLISYYFVEKPFRKIEYKKINILLSILIVFIISFGSFSLFSKVNNGFDDRVHVILKNLSRVNLWEKLNDDKGVCFDRPDNFCNFNSKNDKTVFLIGDSHMEILSYNLLKKLENYNFISINRTDCIYLPNVKKLRPNNQKEFETCTISSKNKINEYIKNKKNSIVIIGGRFHRHFDEGETKWNYKSINNKTIKENFKFSMNNILRENKVILIYPIPSVNFDITKRIMNEVPKNIFNATEYLTLNPFTTDYNDYIKENEKIIEFFNSINHKNLSKIYPDKIFCDKTVEKKCFTHEGKNIFYSDNNHLSDAGVEKLNYYIFQKIIKISKSN